ncbi:mucin-associated surface protein [Glycomyces sp. L485]|uniref:TadE family type IV pilus minor pilin n=1 Tax=Glycomyces sp. L485 TaxID=2909235 RepID=UPI001F4B9C17|nr:TadE family type IV pilus minor pilin [Glycomyces sp. L485]MCH7229523.1 mucin-associated surface protein [Glycomyces sp. L485]
MTPVRGRPHRLPRRTDTGQRGFVTAELAAVLPAVVAVLALAIWAVATVGVKVRAIDAANSAALAAARGEDPQAVAAAYLPEGSSVSVAEEDDMMRATVTAPARPLGSLTPAVQVRAEATAPKEPGMPE